MYLISSPFPDLGFQPIHEAVREGHLEVVEFLIENGADINARTSQGLGSSVFNIAKNFLDRDDPVYALLAKLGAEDWEDELLYVDFDGAEENEVSVRLGSGQKVMS